MGLRHVASLGKTSRTDINPLQFVCEDHLVGGCGSHVYKHFSSARSTKGCRNNTLNENVPSNEFNNRFYCSGSEWEKPLKSPGFTLETIGMPSVLSNLPFGEEWNDRWTVCMFQCSAVHIWHLTERKRWIYDLPLDATNRLYRHHFTPYSWYTTSYDVECTQCTQKKRFVVVAFDDGYFPRAFSLTLTTHTHLLSLGTRKKVIHSWTSLSKYSPKTQHFCACIYFDFSMKTHFVSFALFCLRSFASLDVCCTPSSIHNRKHFKFPVN